jgi:hypothetical protein
LAELKATGTVQQFDKELLHRDGSRVPVLVGAAQFEAAQDTGVAFVVEIDIVTSSGASDARNRR